LTREPRGEATDGILGGPTFFCPPATLEDERVSRTSRTEDERAEGAVVVAAENAEREFVEIMRRTVMPIL